ncbi:hypothetical protein BD410DRAFT_841070 [Rickenella mellea]|uniref:F-box domain-containing protein n=1 Tax=Rickenella mellea TaxID=50990 RepID=A0A4Y7Q186_9AGAM|nr:hypothetical protein BD410DRAFT_841070 [Rickenella mellea]
MSLVDLPPELLLNFISLALYDNPHPVSVLLINPTFLTLGQTILHADLAFTTIHQIEFFSKGDAPLAIRPRSLTVTLSGGTSDFRLFGLLRDALKRCNADESHRTSKLPEARNYMIGGLIHGGPLELDKLGFCFNTHTTDPNLPLLFDVLSRVNPKEFSWIGPDPDHHFSIAIVPDALRYLFPGIASWSNITHITLTNISFLHYPNLSPVSASLISFAHANLKHLTTILFRQATFLNPLIIAMIACAPQSYALRTLRVVDAYSHSIWGPRVRHADVERAVLSTEMEVMMEESHDWNNFRNKWDRVERVKEIVRCGAHTKRINGGDNETHDLEVLPDDLPTCKLTG